MKKIDHLPYEEQRHFIKCDCGAYYDMRNLSDVFRHFHKHLPYPAWNYSVMRGEARAYTRSKEQVCLN